MLVEQSVLAFTDPGACFLFYYIPQTFPDKNLLKWRYREGHEALLNDGPSSMLRPHLERSGYRLYCIIATYKHAQVKSLYTLVHYNKKTYIFIY